MLRPSAWVASVLLASACASSPSEPAAVPAPTAGSTATPDAKESAATAKAMPTTCADAGGDCTPPASFARAICEGDYPTVALSLFAKGTPWTRGYLTRKTQAWNASGGASSNEELGLDEEVIVVRVREANTGGIVVSGAGKSYDVVRWDGACVTLSSDELTTARRPGKPRYPRILWTRLDVDTREALRKNAAVDDAYRAVRKECKGASMGAVSKACEIADGKLVAAVVDYVRSGAELPPPREIP